MVYKPFASWQFADDLGAYYCRQGRSKKKKKIICERAAGVQTVKAGQGCTQGDIQVGMQTVCESA